MVKNPFRDALAGLKEALKTQRNLRFHFLAALLVVLAALFFSITLVEWIVLFFAIMTVITAELMNTAVEYVVDIVCPEMNEMARKAKDIGAAAVLITAIFSAIIGFLIFTPYILSLLK